MPPFFVGVLGLLLVLAPRHQAWLDEEVHFIISSAETERFLELESDEERDRFIESFWRERDRGLGFSSPEARAIHALRLAEVDRRFGNGPLRGRFTERGRLYQLLGPPRYRESFLHASGLVPVELWHYTGVAETFLPDSFYLILFRRTPASDYAIWNPVVDGMAALLETPEPGRFYLDSDLGELSRIDPELGEAVARLVPGEDSLAGVVSLLASLDAFADLADRERHRGDVGRVRSSASFRRLGGALRVHVAPDDAGVVEIHYALDLAPRDTAALAWERVGERYRTSVTLVGRLHADGGERERWVDRLELDVSSGEWAALETRALRFQGRRLLDAADRGFELVLVGADGSSVVRTERLPPPSPPPESSGPARVVERVRTKEEEARYRHERGRAYARRGRRDRAIEEFFAACEATPNVLELQLELAALLFAEGRAAQLVTQLAPLQDRFSDEPDVFVWLAAASEALGDWHEAIRFYERALALTPDSSELRHRLERARRRTP